MKYKVRVSEWYLQHRPSPDSKLPVKLDRSGKTVLIGEGDEVITEVIDGIEQDPRFVIEEVKEEKPKKPKKEVDE